MPPKRAQITQKDPNREGRVLLAIKAIQTDQIPSIREAARQFNIPESTLRTRLAGTLLRSLTHANSHKLTQSEEESLI